MSTIKIDRGFTQKIQAKGLVHSPAMDPVPPPKKPRDGKGKKMPVAYVVAGAAAGIVGLIVLAVALSGDERKSAKPGAAAKPAAAPAAAAGQAERPVEKEQYADPDEEFYAKNTGRPDASYVPPPSPSSSPSKPVNRDLPLGGPQGLLCEYFEKIQTKQISAIRQSPNYPTKPDRTAQVADFELSEQAGDRYGARVRGFLIPSASGKYRFSAACDDSVELWLGTDETPGSARKIVAYEGSVPVRKWTARRDQESAECELRAGQRYYLEAFLKEDGGSDHLSVAWKGPVSDGYTLIDKRYLLPWSDEAAKPAAAETPPAGASARAVRETLLAPARAAVAEQWKKNAAAHRYAEAAEALKNGKASWSEPEALALIERAILRFELLGRLRAYVQAELAKAPVRGVWTAFGGALDVTTASDEGVTVSPGRIVEWSKVPADQFLRLVNVMVPKAVADPNTKGILFLAAAVFCKEVNGGVELALKYRERALANYAGLEALAERVLDGTPESIQAEVRLKAIRTDLARLAVSAAALGEKAAAQQAGLASITGLVSGIVIEYWEKNPYGNLKDVIAKGLLNQPPDSTCVLDEFESPKEHAEKFVARLRGYITPSESGEYYFYLAADDQGELWLSLDETPERLALCVRTENYTNYRAWNKERHRSMPVKLVKGAHYFVEALLREGEKNDHLSVAWSLVGDDDPKVVKAPHLLYAATAGFTPTAEELRKKIQADLLKVQALVAAVDTVKAFDQLRLEADERPSAAMAEAFQAQVTEAKASLREAEGQMKSIDEALLKLKAASRTNASVR